MDGLTTDRIPAVRFGVLVIVATLTRQRQIFQGGIPSPATREDVFHRKRLHGKTCLTVAVLAAPFGSICNFLQDFRGDAGLRHQSDATAPIPPSRLRAMCHGTPCVGLLPPPRTNEVGSEISV